MGSEEFFKELNIIQDSIINVMLSQQNKYDSVDKIITDTTYEAIYRVLELIDGFGVNNTQYELKNLNTGHIINEKKNMHDKCEEVLLHTDL